MLCCDVACIEHIHMPHAVAGGLFLDVKSAYSKPEHLRAFVSSLAGVGVHVRAVCSFNPRQLAFPGACQPPLV